MSNPSFPMPSGDQLSQPGQIEFSRLKSWKQLGLGGVFDCKGPFFLINLTTTVLIVCCSLGLIIVFNLDQSFPEWDGQFKGELTCEAQRAEAFIIQPIDAASCIAYIIVGVFCGALGAYDRVSWREREAIWRETHLPTVNSPPAVSQGFSSQIADPSQHNSTGRQSYGRQSIASSGTNKTTFSVEHDELTSRRLFTEYILGKRGSPSLLIRQPIWSGVFALSSIFLGVTGFLYHGSLTILAKSLDDLALWIVIVTLLTYSWARYFSAGVRWKFWCLDCTQVQDNPRRSSLLLTIICLAIAAGFDIMFYVTLDAIEEQDLETAALVGALVLFSIPMFLHYCARSSTIGSGWTVLVLSMLLLLGGYLLNEFDVPGGTLCFPDSKFQPHAAWHVLSAFGFFFTYLFFRSDFYFGELPIDHENSPLRIHKRNEHLASSDHTNTMAHSIARRNPHFSNVTSGAQEGRTVTYSISETAHEEQPVAPTPAPRESGRKSKRRASRTRRLKAAAPPASSQSLLMESNESLSANRNLKQEGDVSIESRWTCQRCDYTENLLPEDLRCKQCGLSRPAIESLVPSLPVQLRSQHSLGRNSGTRRPSAYSIASSQRTGHRITAPSRGNSIPRRQVAPGANAAMSVRSGASSYVSRSSNPRRERLISGDQQARRKIVRSNPRTNIRSNPRAHIHSNPRTNIRSNPRRTVRTSNSRNTQPGTPDLSSTNGDLPPI